MVKQYHSGVSDRQAYSMLREARVRHILVDPFDLENVTPDFPHVALDCGTYRAMKEAARIAQSGDPSQRNKYLLSVDDYERRIKDAGRDFDLVMSLDVWGAQEQSFLNYKTLTRRGLRVTPVWVYERGGNRRLLNYYLDRADVVALGGLVPGLREEDEGLLRELTELCNSYPNRLHILGLRWLRAIDELKGLLYSADTSKFLAGARRGSVIFVHERTGRLREAHARVFEKSQREDIRAWASLDRRQRCILSARFLEAACTTTDGADVRKAA
jgi:hypothetical protein